MYHPRFSDRSLNEHPGANLPTCRLTAAADEVIPANVVMADTIPLIDEDIKHLTSASAHFGGDDSLSPTLDTTFPSFEDFSPRQEHDARDFPFHLSGSCDGFASLSEYLNPIPDVPTQDPTSPVGDLIAQPDDENLPDAPETKNEREHSVFSVLSRDPHLPDVDTISSSHYRSLKPVPTIWKQSHHRSTIGSPITLAKHTRSVPASNASEETAPALPPMSPTMPPTADARIPRDSEMKRLQHNQMMRANRSRANSKFNDMENLLNALASPSVREKPMRNKMQVLDRVMLQYPALQARKASLRAELVLTTCAGSMKGRGLAEALGSSLVPACETVARLAFGKHFWKYAEVYECSDKGSKLRAAIVSPGNMLGTREKLQWFSARQASSVTSRLVDRAAKLGASLWVPDVRCKEKDDVAETCNVSTALFTPVVLKEGKRADAVIALYHADDELVSYPGGVRPYDANIVAQVDELSFAIRDNPRMVM